MKTPDRLKSTLAQLAEHGADRFDPVRFRYIASLVRRSTYQRPSVRRRLADKALSALDEYQRRFEAACEAATHLTTRIAKKNPDLAESLRRRLEQCDFHGIRRRVETADIRDVGSSRLSPLTDQIAEVARLAGDNAVSDSLVALMQKQEQEIVAAIRNPSGDPGTPAAGGDGRLRAIPFFEKNWADDHAHRFVSSAITNVPEDPGHLNSQMLVTRCLTAMSHLAPDYLRHWIRYMESLLWLEGAGREEDLSRLGRSRHKP